MKNSSYIDAQIALIPDCGDDALYRLASYLEIFDNLAPDTRFSPEQRQTIENFIIGWQALPEEECVASEWDFPENQYIAHGCDVDTAIELSESWRRGEYLPIAFGMPIDGINKKLNQMTNQPIGLDK
ncbi:hypothetical protein [Microcoleus sp. AT9b-C5]|uniref:hypothetical protein n=1 Tax=unclassified Microcoleus TaxID=2642155 RepID=UPI002FD51461